MEEIILSLYSFILTGALMLASPMLLFRPKTRAGLAEKFGIISVDLKKKLSNCSQPVWIHAVSVGEFNGAFPFIQAFKAQFPNRSLIVSITTKAGHEMAVKRAGDLAQVIYFPFDLPNVVRQMLALIKPTLVIIFETELWPNFISLCWRKQIPVVLLNARMSPRSFKGYKSIRLLFAKLLGKLILIGAQTELEARNYKLLADNTVEVKVFGNLKYDWPANIDTEKRDLLKKKLGIAGRDIVLVAGSTHAGEEKMILDLYRRFDKENSDQTKKLRVIVVPRHPERFEEVANMVESEGYKAIRYSRSETFVDHGEIYILDTIGLLADYYSLASIAFVGGTLAKVGGHNLLEPYLYGVPVVCGPHLFKTKETAKILNDTKALFIGADADEVIAKIMLLIDNPDMRSRMGNIGQSWLQKNRGAVERSMTAIVSIITQQEISDENHQIQKSHLITNKVNP